VTIVAPPSSPSTPTAGIFINFFRHLINLSFFIPSEPKIVEKSVTPTSSKADVGNIRAR
jgi:hypothetical protein